MAAAPYPKNEADRLAALRSYDILDTACEENFDEIARLAARLSHCSASAISLIDSERQWFKAQIGLDLRETSREVSFCAHAILDTGPLIVRDATTDERFRDNPLVTGEPGIRFYAGIPLQNAEGYCLGSLCVLDQQPRDISAEELETLTSLARTAMTTLDLHRAMNQVRTLALTDALTGIANRAAFLDGIERTITNQARTGTRFTLIYLDLDGFKAVNDRFGHAAGDTVLRLVAHALKDNTRRGDLSARIGGDEFAVLLCGEDCGDAQMVGERVRAAVSAALEPGGWLVTASVGSVCFQSAPADPPTALSMVDKLMYAAKQAGKNRVSWTCHNPQSHIPAPPKVWLG